MTTHLQNEMMTVRQVRWIGNEVFELSLEREGLVFVPGDCLALFAADGRVSRPYSIASGIHDDCLRFAIRHMPGGVVSSFLSNRKSGETVRVSPPFGWFRPGENFEKRPYIFVATGTGVAPFLAFLRSYPELNPEQLYYGVRNLKDLYEPEWLLTRTQTKIAVSREKADSYFHGRVTALLAESPVNPETDYYLCGLDVMIDEVTVMLEQRGVDITRIHRECFFNASYYT